MNKLIKGFLSTDFDDNNSIVNIYDVVTVSYFDHYLTAHEYSEVELLCYSDIKANLDKEKLFNQISDKFIKLYESLYYFSGEQSIVYVEGNPYTPKLYDQYNLFVINAMKEKPLCQLLYPSLMMFAVTGYDLTHQFFFLKDNDEYRSVQKKIEILVSNVGLNIIE